MSSWQLLSPDGLLVVHQSFMQLALLLQDTGQVGMGHGKLWVHLKEDTNTYQLSSVETTVQYYMENW